MSAKVTNKIEMPDWYGKDLANKVIVFPTGRGGIFSTAMLMGLAKKGLGPKAMINIKTHPGVRVRLDSPRPSHRGWA